MASIGEAGDTFVPWATPVRGPGPGPPAAGVTCRNPSGDCGRRQASVQERHPAAKGLIVMADSAKALALASRLRGLRELTEAPYRVTQADVAAALGVTPQQVSHWESRRVPQVPPADRLAGYARLFSSWQGLRDRPPFLVPDDEVKEPERAGEAALLSELMELRRAAVGGTKETTATGPAPGGFWCFPDGRPVVVVASRCADPAVASSSDPRNPDFSAFHTYVDADAVVEIYGQICAGNPTSEISVVAHDAVPANRCGEHLVVVGSRHQNVFVDWFRTETDLPVVADIPTGDLAVTTGPRGRRFLVREDSEAVKRSMPYALPAEREDVDGVAHLVYRAQTKGWVPLRWSVGEPGARPAAPPSVPRLYRDVALIARRPNPLNQAATVTLVCGLHGRGTFGAARVFADPAVRARNEGYLTQRVGGRRRFWALLSVVCDRGTPDPVDVTPVLGDESACLLECYG